MLNLQCIIRCGWAATMLSRISGLRGKNAALEIGFARIFIITNEMGIFGGRSLFAIADFPGFWRVSGMFQSGRRDFGMQRPT